jgi:hypothetical protein
VRTPRPAGRPQHAVAALDGITGAHADWADSKGLHQRERKAPELSEERSELGYGIGYIEAPVPESPVLTVCNWRKNPVNLLAPQTRW